MPDSDTTNATGAATPATADGRKRLVSGPGLLLVWLYGVMVVGAVSRSAFQISTEFDRAPLAYALSAVAALAYAFITYSLVRGGETARKAALICCAAELAGVLAVGTWTLVRPESFPDTTVWSQFGMGYLFIPVILPITGMLWLRKRGEAATR
ncbi:MULTISPECIES: hypothetical protein [Streptomyces]|uniref:Integral membrane protein n=1 Tax=Streptomyces spororaveus TaxID=284039 RepID=A0ABQ3TL82_9ACTN|nr:MULTISPECIES: hypothetical protein [Streptomyces]MCM9078533.1 hypothetical protein [Streptomyces spororaveus]MCX5307050.1 hypothetical protein [Streptomyces sp. NBC_00160]GHI81146.1 hypothetical protein Sspor_67070 [Streptomyces spororaveus]